MSKRRKIKISFYDWCYINLPKEEADEIMARWDYDKNIDKNGNKLTPKDVSFKSNKQYLFKCLSCPEHTPELKYITSFTRNNKKSSSLNCNQCNVIAYTHPHLVKYLVNKEDAYKYSYGISRKLSVKCPDCGYEKDIYFGNLIKQGLGCICRDGKSYPEKFLFNFLTQLLKDDFSIQLTKNNFKWCDQFRYDFYIPIINGIIETHGLQHYEERMGWSSPEELQKIDKNKEYLAKQNGITNYITLDCRRSELKWIKNSIMNSELPSLLNFKEDDIDWLKCHEFSCKNLVKVICDLWDTETKSVLEIAEQFKVNRNTVVVYLKQGAELGWCNYDPIKETLEKSSLIKPIKIICLTTGEIFNSISDAFRKYNITNISNCCLKKYKYAGKHPITNEKMVWMYYDEYLQTINNN